MPTRKEQLSKISRKISVTEFKAWLEGVQEIGGKDWVPTAAQWKKIKSKIDLLQEAVVQQFQTVSMVQPNIRSIGSPQPGISPDPTGTNVSSASLGHAPEPPPFATHPTLAVKTPDIDTSDGKYASPFV